MSGVEEPPPARWCPGAASDRPWPADGDVVLWPGWVPSRPRLSPLPWASALRCAAARLECAAAAARCLRFAATDPAAASLSANPARPLAWEAPLTALDREAAAPCDGVDAPLSSRSTTAAPPAAPPATMAAIT